MQCLLYDLLVSFLKISQGVRIVYKCSMSLAQSTIPVYYIVLCLRLPVTKDSHPYHDDSWCCLPRNNCLKTLRI